MIWQYFSGKHRFSVFVLLLAVIALFWLGQNEAGLRAETTQKRGFMLPVLCYHQISADADGPFCISPEVFEKQMRYLYMNGFTVISVGQLTAFLREYRESVRSGLDKRPALPRKAIVITFDDNYPSIVHNALPVLIRYGFRATNFLYCKFMNNNSWRWYRQVARTNTVLDFESHTFSHHDLTESREGESRSAYRRRLFYELRFARKELARYLKKDIRYLAYPYGVANETVTRLARLSGYRAMFSALGGYVTDKSSPDKIPRFTIFRKFDHETFVAIVNGHWQRERLPYPPRKDHIVPREYHFNF